MMEVCGGTDPVHLMGTYKRESRAQHPLQGSTQGPKPSSYLHSLKITYQLYHIGAYRGTFQICSRKSV